MGLYLEPPTTSKADWARENLRETPVLPEEFPTAPDKNLVILIGMPHQPLWWIHSKREFDRMWSHMRSNPSFERATQWFYASNQQINETVAGANLPTGDNR